jgi:hypothetical protein
MGVVDSREHLTSHVTRYLIPYYNSNIVAERAYSIEGRA